ncbi:DICT sensory domain-containing protein [Halorarius litoreus]|uniref:DICT sensory domain-containing protein n=1 Tax=Halorarius litoreus TaxID=2962676 RepID=UPI0020CD74F4|nr:DICT sensory domain-containing protein [Halorarius litoreus]
MSLREIIAAVESTPTHLRICSPGEYPDLRDRFGTRNVVVEHTRLPGENEEGFVIVRKGGEFVGSVELSALQSLANPRTAGPGSAELGDDGFDALLDLLDDTVFSSFDRRQMLATTREIEDRAWRLGHGRLYAGFQSLSAMQDQVGVYEQLATKPGLEIAVYGQPDWEPPSIEGVTVHATDAPEISRVWFVVFEGSVRLDSCALLAEERDPGRFYGFWTYDPDRVDAILEEIERADADGT